MLVIVLENDVNPDTALDAELDTLLMPSQSLVIPVPA